MAVLRLFIKRPWLIVVLVTAFFTIVSTRTSVASPTFWIGFALSALLSLGFFLSLFRFGLFATCVMFFVFLTTSGMALTLNMSSLYATSSV